MRIAGHLRVNIWKFDLKLEIDFFQLFIFGFNEFDGFFQVLNIFQSFLQL